MWAKDWCRAQLSIQEFFDMSPLHLIFLSALQPCPLWCWLSSDIHMSRVEHLGQQKQWCPLASLIICHSMFSLCLSLVLDIILSFSTRKFLKALTWIKESLSAFLVSWSSEWTGSLWSWTSEHRSVFFWSWVSSLRADWTCFSASLQYVCHYAKI